MDHQFLDLASKANELGLSESALRARILSNDGRCFVYLAGIVTYGADPDQYLPVWTRPDFPFVRWEDHGAVLNSTTDTGFGRTPRGADGSIYPHHHKYQVRGFVGLDQYAVDTILTQGEYPLDGAIVYVCNRDLDDVGYLVVVAPPKIEWVAANPDVYAEGALRRDVPFVLKASDLFMLAKPAEHAKPEFSDAEGYPEELRAAIEAFQAVRRTFKPAGRSPKTVLTEWLAKHKPELGSSAIDRIATLVNWQKRGGAPKTPGSEN
jgi:hypothetical protein